MGLKRGLALLVCLFTLACAQSKTSSSVMPESNEQKNQDSSESPCASPLQNRIQNRFVVQWENGAFTVEHAENIQSFVKNFLEPHLQSIRHAEYDKVISLSDEFNVDAAEALPAENWGQQLTQLSAAQNQNIRGDGVVVAIVDTSVDYSHPILKTQTVPGWDYVTNTAQNPTPHSHATHIAGIISGREGGRIQGVAPGSKVMGVSFMDSSGSGSMGNAILAMNFAADRGVRIINNSWGGSYCSEAMRQAMIQLAGRDVLLVVAAGNDGVDVDRYPTFPTSFNLLTQLNVAASTFSDVLATFSNTSWKTVQLAAPGENIYSSVPGGYAYMSGTSMAAPFVSGAAALLKGLRPEATSAQIKQALINSVDHRPLRVSSEGRLNISKAVDEIRRLVP